MNIHMGTSGLKHESLRVKLYSYNEILNNTFHLNYKLNKLIEKNVCVIKTQATNQST